ncbi:MAG: hypothetical protein B7W95_00965, partial [Acidimicrobiales bacterium 20-64-4]
TGHIMVGNLTSEVIELSRQSAAADPSVVGSLALLTHQSVATIQADLNNVQYSPYEPTPVYQDAPQSMIEFIRLHPGEFPGVTAVQVSTRTYPYGGATGAQILGYVTPITGAEISANPNAGYTTSSVYGQAGIENFYENYLRGVPGQRTVEVNAYGNIIGSTETVAPRTGDTVVLNIDASLQKALDTYLSNDIKLVRSAPDPTTGIVPAAVNGAALVMDVRTGAVLAMSSYPSYNLNDFTNGLSQSTFNTLEKEGAFYNYPLQGLYTPGSTFKLITATTMMQTGIYSPYTIFSDTGSYTVPGCVGSPAGCTFHDDLGQGAGQIDLQGALTVSSDAYFYNLGYLFWSQQGWYGETPIQNVAHQYGLDQLTNIDLPGEFAGRVDSPVVRLQLHQANPTAFPNYHWYTGDNLGEKPDSRGTRGRGAEPFGNGLRHLPALRHLLREPVPGRRKDRYGVAQQESRAELPLRGLRPREQPPVRRRLRHRPGRLRLRGLGAGRRRGLLLALPARGTGPQLGPEKPVRDPDHDHHGEVLDHDDDTKARRLSPGASSLGT